MTPNGKVDRKALAALPVTHQADHSQHLGARDELESRMVRIWEAVFAIHPFGVRNNFFEMGGHSLLALRLMHRVEQEFGQVLPPAVLFQAPTVEQLCDILRQEGWKPRWVSLVPIQPKGARPAFFCVHGLGGHVMRFGALARHLGPDQPFYGLQSRGLDGKHPCDATVEQMAANYIEEMRSLQPQGPYRIGGYSFGGAVAYEMARQLAEQDQEVALLALLDAYPRTMQKRESLLGTFLKLSLREKFAYAISKRQMIVRRIRSRMEAMSYPAALKQVHEANAIAERAYAWPEYGGRVWLFRASEKGLRGQNQTQMARGGQWEIHELVGDHGSIIREPRVRDLAEQITACLETPVLAGQLE
jgi:aspartate racemase